MSAARARAAERGEPRLAPPAPLSTCDRGLIEGALAAPAHSWEGKDLHPDFPSKAASLLYAFAKIQPCVEGNKRLALLIVDGFLRVNGVELAVRPGCLADIIIAAAESDARDHKATVSELTHWFRGKLVAREEEDG